MKLLDLIEALAAPVHVNVDKTLTVIPHLVQHGDEFSYLPVPCSSCLFIQVLHTISAVTGIPAVELAKQLRIRRTGMEGHTLEEIFQLIQSTPVKYKRYKYSFELGVKTYKNIDQALEAVEAGQPVIAVIRLYEALSNAVTDMEDRIDQSGIVNVKRPGTRSYDNLFHTLLIIGYDKPHDHVIMREIRSMYGYKGYLKVSKSVLKKHPNLVKRYLAVTVEDVKKEKA